jgi:hypothetical protein
MEFFGLSLMLGADIILGMLYRYWDSMKPKPLTFLEFFNFMYDQKSDIIKILEHENEETRKQLFNNYLNTRDLINKKDGKN